MTERTATYGVAVIGGGAVGAAIAFTLAHRGLDIVLLEAERDLAYGASGTNSGVLHTGFDSPPGELETELILRAADIRPQIMSDLGIPVMECGAELIPRSAQEAQTVGDLARNAGKNGVHVDIRDSDGALMVPGESVTDPVAYTRALAHSGAAAGATIVTGYRVEDVALESDRAVITATDGREICADVAINAAGLYADNIADMVGDATFEVYPRKGEFLVFQLPSNATLDRILLPVPTERTKGVLVFPTLDGKVVAGPTAVDGEDKTDWSVRQEAFSEIYPKAAAQYPPLHGLTPVAQYAGLRPAGRGCNYVVEPSSTGAPLINVAAIRSTGLTASLGIADYVCELLPEFGVEAKEQVKTAAIECPESGGQWWNRAAQYRRLHQAQR